VLVPQVVAPVSYSLETCYLEVVASHSSVQSVASEEKVAEVEVEEAPSKTVAVDQKEVPSLAAPSTASASLAEAAAVEAISPDSTSLDHRTEAVPSSSEVEAEAEEAQVEEEEAAEEVEVLAHLALDQSVQDTRYQKYVAGNHQTTLFEPSKR
jgi:hypothetical protein